MDVEILIHGVPDGQDYYGIKDEQTNMGLLYDNSKESVKFIVETKKHGNNAYAYYTYLRYSGMIGAGGRPGSYFGLTMRIDKYYQDAIHIYNLLEMAFKKYIVGTLLIPSGDAYKYSVTNFAAKATEIGQMQQALLQLIQTTCSSTKFLDIDASFIHPIAAAPSANIADVSDTAILASIKKYSKVVLSPDYELNIVKEYKKKVQDAVGNSGSIVAEKDKKIAEQERTISSLNTTVANQSNRITVLEQESKRKDAEIQQLKQSGNMAKVVAAIKEPITALADYFRLKDSPKPPQPPTFGHKNYILGLLSCSLSLVVLVLCLITMLKSPSKSSNDSDKFTELIAELREENTNLKNDIDLKNEKIKELENRSPAVPTRTTLTIHVKGCASGQKLSTGHTYTAIVKDGNNNFGDNKGSWTLANATITNGANKKGQITFKPNGNGQVKLEYRPNDTIYICNAITFDAEKPEVTSLSIDVAGYTSGKLSKDEQYKVTIKNEGKPFAGKGTWILENAEIKNGQKSDASITIQPTGNGKVTLNYKASDSKYKCNARSFEVDKPQSAKEQPADQTIDFKLQISPNVSEVYEDSTYTIKVLNYNGEVAEWRYDGCSGNKQSELTSKIKILKDATEAVITFVPKGMSLEEAQRRQLKFKIKKSE